MSDGCSKSHTLKWFGWFVSVRFLMNFCIWMEREWNSWSICTYREGSMFRRISCGLRSYFYFVPSLFNKFQLCRRQMWPALLFLVDRGFRLVYRKAFISYMLCSHNHHGRNCQRKTPRRDWCTWNCRRCGRITTVVGFWSCQSPDTQSRNKIKISNFGQHSIEIVGWNQPHMFGGTNLSSWLST